MGISYRVDLAAAELELGQRAEADKQLNIVLAMIGRMISSGVARHATYELRAKVYALMGRGDDAMSDLRKASRLGWRRAWWADHEPYFASLRSRSDFQELVSTVNRSNQSQIENIRADGNYPGGVAGERQSTNAGKSTKLQGRMDGWPPPPDPPLARLSSR
jgi:hypothetical protein